MSEWLNQAFSGGVSLARINPVGIVLMALAVALNATARPISKKWPENRQPHICGFFRLGALLICCVGAAVAIL